MSVQKLRWSDLDAGAREEITALIAAARAHTGDAADRYVSDFGDASGWYLLLGLSSLGGLLGCGWMMMDGGVSGALTTLTWIPSNPGILLLHPHILGFWVALVVAVWVAVRWSQDATRRGVAVTRDAVVQVRGPRVTLLRYADVASVEQRTLGARGKRFTVVSFTARDGTKLEIHATGRWAEAAAGAMASAQAG